MGLLVDTAFLDAASTAPALQDMLRPALVEALFTRNDRALPPELVAVLGRQPSVTVKAKSDVDVAKLVQVANGQESTVSLGLSAEDFHYVRRQLEVGKDRDIGIYLRPFALTTHPWIVPPQGGIEIDVRDLSEIEIDEKGHRAVVGIGCRWKALYDAAVQAGHIVPFFPVVPLDYGIVDAFAGDALFESYRAPFRRYLLGVRSFTSHGRKARLGFEEVPNHGTGYDLLNLLQNSLTEFVVPVAASFLLAPRPRVVKNIAFHYPDPAKLAEALAKLTASARSPLYANVYDASAWQLLRPGATGGPFTLELGLAGAPTVLAAREKGIEALLAGFTAKEEIASPYDVEARSYAKNAEKIGRLLFPGYVLGPAKSFADLVAKLKSVSQAERAKMSLFGSVRAQGSFVLAPGFDTPKERPKIYSVSHRVWDLVNATPGSVYLSRLAHLWSEDRMYRERLAWMQKLKSEIDSAKVVEPRVVPR